MVPAVTVVIVRLRTTASPVTVACPGRVVPIAGAEDDCPLSVRRLEDQRLSGAHYGLGRCTEG